MNEVISKALSELFNSFVANFLPALAEIVPELLKKLPSPSVCTVLTLTLIDFFQSQITNFSAHNLISSPVFLLNVISLTMFFVPLQCLWPAQ